LFLIYPAILGQLSGVLNFNSSRSSINITYQRINGESEFARTLWFPERPSWAFSSVQKPGLSANSLYKERPFASMIEGDYDLFGFLHSPQLPQWLDLLGIKYLVFPENERKKIWTDRERWERGLFLQFISQLPGLSKQEWLLPFPVYRSGASSSHLFTQNSAYLVVGGEDIYQQLVTVPNFSLKTQAFFFLEDGRFPIEQLDQIGSEGTKLLIEKGREKDLAMIFFREKMVSLSEANFNQWAVRQSGNYLQWKAELAERGIKVFDFDFGKGIAFSSQAGEKMIFKLQVPQKGEYLLALRFTNASDSGGLKVVLADKEMEIKSTDSSRFKWQTEGPFTLEKGLQTIEINNISGVSSINTLALVSTDDYHLAQERAIALTGRIPTIVIGDKSDWNKVAVTDSKEISLQAKSSDPTQYQIQIPSTAHWLIFSDHFDSRWQMEDAGITSKSLPAYAMVNGFYLSQNKDSWVTVIFTPQKLVLPSIILSSLSLVVIVTGSFAFYLYRSHKSSKRKADV
jgi:hypothetical protein